MSTVTKFLSGKASLADCVCLPRSLLAANRTPAGSADHYDPGLSTSILQTNNGVGEEELSFFTTQKSSYPKGQIDVFLHEGLINDAITALDPYASHMLVVDAALQSQSQLDWVIQACRKQAEYIMDRGKAELYSSAANWLAKARKAYQMLEHKEE